MINRKIAPEIKDISKLILPQPKKHVLDNGIPVYEINIGTQPALKLEIVFNAGRPYEEKHLVSRATARLLKEGTAQYSAAEIAEELDFYGSSVDIPVNLDTSNMTLFCLSKHFHKVLPILADMLSSPAFTNEELQSFIERHKQKLQVDLSKNDVIAYRTITELIFDSSHPYGYNSSIESYSDLKREDLIAHFNRTYTAANCKVFLSGQCLPEHIELLNRYLGNLIPKGEKVYPHFPDLITSPQQLRLHRKDSLQTAIRVGRRMFNRKHPDHQRMYILNTIFGGYFGSRLMANIREDKGYTYNIYSSAETLFHDGYFCIGTEVGNEVAEATKKEIYIEMERLQNEVVGEEELQMVRNYLLGTLLNSLDGPFNISEMIRTIVTEDLSFDSFNDLVTLIKNIEPKEIQDLAQQFFNKDQMWEVVVGE